MRTLLSALCLLTLAGCGQSSFDIASYDTGLRDGLMASEYRFVAGYSDSDVVDVVESSAGTFSVEAELIDELEDAVARERRIDAAATRAMRARSDAQGALEKHGLTVELDWHNGGYRVGRIYRVASQEVVEFYP